MGNAKAIAVTALVALVMIYAANNVEAIRKLVEPKPA